tara:strand:+ start:1154 stop:2299 length:1146 start_codon:yes stop_codon:yes gene_type:complete
VQHDGPTPDHAIRDTLTGLGQGDAGALWDSLPERYQQEVNTIVRGFASRMDEDVWKQAFALARRLLKVIRSKKELILDNPSLKPKGLNVRLVSESWDELIDLFLVLLDSELSDFQAMRQFEGDSFFPGAGTTALRQLAKLSAKDPNDPFRKGFNADIQLVSIDGDNATISLTMGKSFVMTQHAVDDKNTSRVPVELRRVDDKWMVKELEYGIKKMFQDAHVLLESIPEDAITSNREQLLKLIKSVDEDLDRIELAKTRTQFNQAIGLAVVRMNKLISKGNETAANDEPPLMGRVVTVVLVGTLDEVRRKRLVTRLIQITEARGKPKVTAGDKSTTVVLPTQRFLQDVVDGVDFGTVSAVNEVDRTLTVMLTPDRKQAPPKE